jgi:hypothetical protein
VFGLFGFGDEADCGCGYVGFGADGGGRGLCFILRLSVVTDNFLAMENLQGFEGLSALEESAVRLHEVYKSLLAGGFTEDQALTLIAKMTRPESDS